MAHRPRADINPAVLTWAREQAKLSVEQAAKKVSVKPERFAEWEDAASETKPTIKQLRKLAKVLHRPTSLFYLAEPPTTFQPMRDLRRLPGAGLPFFSPELAFEMELAQQRRELSLELSAAIGEKIPEFSLRASLDEDPEIVGRRIRKALNVRLEAQSKWRRKGALEPFKAWRREIEKLDVLVFQIGRVDWSEVSGFALSERIRPIIAVNRKDVPNRRTFSLLHEFVHLMIGESGTSDLQVDAARPPESQKVEVFCNAAAAAALIPKNLLLEQDIVQRYGSKSVAWDDEHVLELAHLFGVSRVAVLRRLLTFGRTTQAFYEAKAAQWTEEWREEQKRKRVASEESTRKFARNPPVDVCNELGHPFVRLVLDSMNANLMSLNEASGYFGNLRVRHFPSLERQALMG